MKPPRKPKTDDPTLDALISNMRASEALIEAMKAHGRATSSLIAVGSRVAASCAELERRVAALEAPGPRIDETGSNLDAMNKAWATPLAVRRRKKK